MGIGRCWIWDVAKRAARRIYFICAGRFLDISSSRASIHARYGTAVRIGGGTFIDGDVAIGNYSYVNRCSSIEKCDIGRYCSISSGVRINPWNHDLSHFSTSPSLGGSSRDVRERVKIDDDVLISVNAVVLSGVHLATGCVVAAGAVVTKDVEPYEIVGGVPARHIGWRFDEDIRNAFAASGAWNLDPDEAKRILSDVASSF